MKASQRIAAGVSGSLLAVFSAGTPAAEDFHIGVRAGANYSDNVERVPVDENSSSSGIVGLDFSGVRDAGRLQYDAFGNVEYQHFFDDAVDSEVFGQMLARSTYAFVPERFLWSLSGSFDQTRQDLLRPVAPGNMEDVITLATGPQVNLRFGSTLEATLEGHYMIADYSEEPFDNDTAGGSVLFGRRFSREGFLGIGGSFDSVSYTEDDPSVEDFDRQEFFLRFTAVGARTTIDFDAGYSQIEGDTFDEDGPMFRLRATRDLTPSLSAFADYTLEYPTSGGATFAPGSPPQLGTDSSVLTGGPRKSEEGGIGLRLQSSRTDASIGYLLREEEEIETALQRNFDVFTATGTYLFAPRASFTLFGRYTDEVVGDTRSDETIFGGRINFQIGRLTTISLRVEQRDRDSDVLEGSYKETAGGLFVRYGNSTGAEGWR
jgi:hypothetical protein